MNSLKLALDKANNGECIPESLIPKEWEKSFNNFIFGQTCTISSNGEYEFYPQDFLIWYFRNEIQINRSIKIDNIIH